MLSIGAIAAKIFGSSNDRRIKTYRPKVEAINALEPELERLSDAELRARTETFRKQLADGAVARRPAGAGLRHRARGGQAHARPAPFRRAADRRHGAARGQDRRDEDRRRQDAGRHAAGLSQRARRQGRARRHRQRLPRQARRRVDGPHLQVPRPHRRRASCTSSTTTSARAQYACDVTYGTNNELGFDYLRDNMKMRARRDGPARPRLRHRRRGGLDPDRRGAHAAHHLRPGRGPRRALHRRRRADEGPGGRARQDREGARQGARQGGAEGAAQDPGPDRARREAAPGRRFTEVGNERMEELLQREGPAEGRRSTTSRTSRSSTTSTRR